MKKLFLVIFSLIAISLACVIFKGGEAQAQANFDRNFFVGRAYQLASFSSDERIVEPEINFLVAGAKGDEINNYGAFEEDRVIKIVDPDIFLGGVVAVFRAPSYTIDDAGKKTQIKTFKGGVEGILNQAGIELAREDRVEPSLESSTEGISQIKITRVEETELEKFETLSYRIIEIDDPNLERGIRKVSQEGKIGQKRLLYLLRRENGIEVSREKISEKIIEKPVDKIIKNGTKVVVLSSVKGYATIYNPSYCSVVSVNYKKGTLVRITNQANGVTVLKTVDCTWGTVTHPSGVVLDLSRSVLLELKYNGSGKGPLVLVEEIKK